MTVYDIYPDSGIGVAQGDVMLQFEDLFDHVSDTDDKLSLTIRELVQNSLDPIDERDDISETTVRITLKKLTYDFINFENFKRILDKCTEYCKKSYSGDDFKKDKTYRSINKIRKKLSGNSFQSDTIIIEDISGGLNGVSRNARDEKNGLENLVGQFKSSKSKGGGSHGVGKKTAFTLSSINTVFYLNQFNGESRFIGRFIANTYYDKSTNLSYGPNFFFGEKAESNQLVYGEYAKLKDKPPSKLKSLEGDGLSTIIPVDPKKNYSNWTDQVVFSVISNYYKNFLSGNLKVEVINDFEDTKTIIDSKTLNNLYIGIEQKEIIKKTYSLENYHKYQMIKPQILEYHNPIRVEEFKFKFEAQKDQIYNGTCKIRFYKNKVLEEICDDEENRPQNYMKQNFRIIRGNTLIRSHYLPGSPKRIMQVSDYSYCGLVEFSDPFNSVIRTLETQSHDKLNYKYLEEDQPNEQSIKKNVISVLNKTILRCIDELSGNNINEEDEFIVEFEGLSDNESENESPSYKRKLFSEDDVKRLIQKKQSYQNNGNKSGSEFKNAEVDSDGNIIFRRRRIGPPNPFPPPPFPVPNPNPDIEGNEKGIESENGPFKIRNNQTLKGVNFKSYLTESNGSIHRYLLKISGLKNYDSIEIMQDSLIENSVLSFDLKNLKINKSTIPENKFSRTFYNDDLPKSIIVKDLDEEYDNLRIEMEVEEAANTVSEFKLIIK